MRRHRPSRTVLPRSLVLAVLGVALLPGGTARADGVEDGTVVEIRRRAFVETDGSAALVRLKAVCPEGYEVLEGFAHVVQRGEESQWGFFTPVCDGQIHRFEVRVPAYEESPLKPGRASVTGYLLVEDPETGETADGQDFQRVHLQPLT